MARFAKIAGFATPLAVFLMLGAAWLLAAPKGELRLALSPSVQSDPRLAGLAFSLFQRADSAVDDAQKSHSTLSFHDHDPGKPLVEVPPTETPGSGDLADYITNLAIETSVDQNSGRVALSIDGVAFLKLLYSATPWHDHFLQVKEIKEVPCTAEGAVANCYEVAANLSPSGAGLRTELFRGSLDVIGRDLGVLVLRAAVRRGGDLWQKQTMADATPPPYLLANSMPVRMSALENAARGIAILRDGTSHPSCSTLDGSACLKIVRDYLERALAQAGDVYHPMAAFGLSLIETKSAMDAAENLRPAYVIELKLESAERLMNQARRSKFLWTALKKDDLLHRFKLVNLSTLKLDRDHFARVNEFICAIRSYRRGEWQLCIDRTKDIAEFPRLLKPYLKAAHLDANLRNGADADMRKVVGAAIREELEMLKSEPNSQTRDRRIWGLLRVFFSYGCNYPDEVDSASLRLAASRYLDTAPDQNARKVAKVDISGCWPTNDLLPANSVEEIIGNIDSVPEQARHRLETAVAIYYVRTGDLDKSLQFLRPALALPYLGPFVQRATEFRPLMEDRMYKQVFLDAYYQLLPSVEMQTCHDSEN